MRKAWALSAALATSGFFLFALPAAPAAASGFEGSGDGAGTYTVQVNVSGSGAGSGGSLKGPAVSSGGGSVSVPSPCGYDPWGTQEGYEAVYGGDKEMAEAMLAAGGGPGYAADGYAVAQIFATGLLANWGNTGMWYLPRCDGGGKFDKFAADNPPTLVGGGAAAGPPQATLDPAFLEDIAIRAMTLPKPAPGHNPSADVGQTFVNVPGGTWFWATWPTPYNERRVTAEAGGVSATAIATFNGTTFTSSGGAAPNSIFCRDGGKPYTSGAAESSCHLNYVSSSGRGAYTVTAASRWTAVVTSSLGSRGLPGATMIGTSAVRVGEIQTINR